MPGRTFKGEAAQGFLFLPGPGNPSGLALPPLISHAVRQAANAVFGLALVLVDWRAGPYSSAVIPLAL